MNNPPGGFGQSRYYYETAEPLQEYTERQQTESIYSGQSTQLTTNYEPFLNGGDGLTSYTSAPTPSQSSSYSFSASSTQRQGGYISPGESFSCQSCLATFSRSADRTRHYNTVHVNHGRPFRCDVEDCPAGVTSWTRADKLKAHIRKWHNYSCEESGCGRGYPHGFQTQEELETHHWEAHGEQADSYTVVAATSTSKGKFRSLDEADENEGGEEITERAYKQPTSGSYTPHSTYTPASSSLYISGALGAPQLERAQGASSLMQGGPAREVLDDRKLDSVHYAKTRLNNFRVSGNRREEAKTILEGGPSLYDAMDRTNSIF